MKSVTPQKLKEMLNDNEELALLDLREQGVFVKEHQLLACCVPLSHIEFKIADLVPRRTTRIVLVDDGPLAPLRLVEKAAVYLADFGYSNVLIMEGGIGEWRAAGFELFYGVNVPSKAFGEFVELTCETPRIAAEELKAKIDAGEKLVIMDSRTKEEYHMMSIPGAISVPGAELVYRVQDIAPDPQTIVVVNCAGRTRSIIGAQSLINAGISNPVAALKNGTMGWKLTGLELEYGQDHEAPAPSPAGLAKARVCAARVAKRFGVRMIDRIALDAWREETDRRTLYILDVRSPDEFEAGHLKGARNAPGGQLVQALDEYVAVQNARIVLVDDTEVRAIITASWLVQMGWADVYVLTGGIGDDDLVKGPHRAEVLGFEKEKELSPEELKEMLDSSPSLAVVDLGSSVQFREQHIPWAYWVLRSRMEVDLSKIACVDFFVLTSHDGILAHLAVKEVKAYRPGIPVRVLDGGTKAWIEAGLPIAEGMERAISEVDDVAYKPYEHTDASEEAMRKYLTWEVALVDQIERDGDAKFRAFTSKGS